MNGTEFEERPAKKRRFFVEDSPVHEVPEVSSDLNPLQPEPEHPADLIPEEQPNLNTASPEDGFDVDLLNAFVGEQLPEPTILKLRELSRNDIERGN
jgi:DNA repair protein RAD5